MATQNYHYLHTPYQPEPDFQGPNYSPYKQLSKFDSDWQRHRDEVARKIRDRKLEIDRKFEEARKNSQERAIQTNLPTSRSFLDIKGGWDESEEKQVNKTFALGENAEPPVK